MAWLKIDDGWYMHPKVRAAGLYGRALWQQAAGWCAQQENDGHVPTHMLGVLAALAEIPPDENHATMMRLVGVGLWEEAKTSDGWVFHDWHVYQPSRASLLMKRKRDRRKKELHSKALEPIRALVLARDGEACRYCGQAVVFTGPGSRPSPYAGTFDHVDPSGSNDADNIVVACHSCNSRKKDRTPAEVGMALRSLTAPEAKKPKVAQASTPPAKAKRTPPAAKPRVIPPASKRPAARSSTTRPPSPAAKPASSRKATGPPR